MDWIEVTVQTDEKDIDRRCDELTELGVSGFVIENENDFKQFLDNNRQYWDYVDRALEESYSGVSRIKFYLSDDADGRRQLDEITAALGCPVQTRSVRDADWENNWRQYYKPIEVGNRLIVVPEWEQCDNDGRVPLRLDPGLMFGTGSHATTRMCLEALENFADAGKRVLDLGCGSGILGIGALVLGCGECVSVDIDPKAPDIVPENAALNGIGADRLTVYAGDIIGDASLRARLGAGYDIVLANIVTDVIIPLSTKVRAFMAEDAVFITSGIIDGRETETETALRNAGFEILERKHMDEWNCFVCKA